MGFFAPAQKVLDALPETRYSTHIDAAIPQVDKARRVEMSKFIGYTVGLEAIGEAHKGLVKVEFNEADNGDIEARLVSGVNLGHIRNAGNVKIARDEYDNRPGDDIERAEWAFKKFGMSIIGRPEQA